ncbi:hypothetical protein MKK64_04600 [Methylobacterium sp. E-025]|uniref:hypothetical protein n=1 Tax=Methylobacterium sp. E-025 TaxID=2836561 RepID=UPI001FBB2F4B|nr:hypothetical protein [Methylobacterium sp. E-025]MCJ2110493.1 hypothetical protein [Methylobacterium sp. E-025]
MISLSYKGSHEIVEKIDCLVLARRHENPGESYSRAAFLREAVNRALAGVEITPPKVRARVRERVSAAPDAV